MPRYAAQRGMTQQPSAHFSARVFSLSCPQTAADDLAEYVAGELNPARWELILGDPDQVTLVAEAVGKSWATSWLPCSKSTRRSM